MGYRLDTLADSRRNNLRIVRLVAASAVIFSHSYIVNLGMPALALEPLGRLTGVDCGALAVDVFFVTSGFLVGRSLIRGRDPVDFLLSRALRIYPGLICAVLAMALLLGPIATELSLPAYFHDQRLYRFIFFDGTMLYPRRTVVGLPGVFANLPNSSVVNGSLWTLPWEIWMYIVLLGLFLTGAIVRAYPIVLCLICLLFTLVTQKVWEPIGFVYTLIRFTAMFHAGVAAYRYRDRITLSWPILAALSVATIVANVAAQSTLLLPIWLAYAVLFLAYHPRLVVERWCDGPDYSYGIYIYAYAVQQTLVWRFGPMAVFPSFLLAWGLTMPLAMLSWHLIEKPALGLKEKLRSRRTRVANGLPSTA